MFFGLYTRQLVSLQVAQLCVGLELTCLLQLKLSTHSGAGIGIESRNDATAHNSNIHRVRTVLTTAL